jgi:hypothetical protein
MLFRVLKHAIVGWRKPDLTSSQEAPVPEGFGHRDQATGTPVDELIAYAAGLVTEYLAPDVNQRVMVMADRFNKAKKQGWAPMNVFVYHVDMGEAGRLNYRDVAIDTSRFDYRTVLNTFVASVARWQPDARIYLVTNPGSPLEAFADDRVNVVTLDVAADRPMYERVNAMCAYVHSLAFDADTLFLDSDAFLNAPFQPYLEADYDVAVTVRAEPGLMPVNEGVIVSRVARPDNVRRFFKRYLSTYETLSCDKRIQDYYGDIRRWRGGQLALNAVTQAASPYSPYRDISISGIALRVMPCDPFNYSYAYDEGLSTDKLNDKVIVHLKGGRKTSLDAWLAYTRLDSSQSASIHGKHVVPLFTLWNKEYQKPPMSDEKVKQTFRMSVQSAAGMVNANLPGSGAFLADDMFVWFRNLAFLSDMEFIQAMGPLLENKTLRARIWRVYMLCWAARSCLNLDGDYVDLGCYDGHTVSVIERYCRFREIAHKRYWLYDIFDEPPEESRKAGHGPGLFDYVRQTFEPLGNFTVIKGAVPQSFAQGLPDKIAFAQIDLNAAEPELAALEIIYERIVCGGIIVFDDYGFRRYRESNEKESSFLRSRGQFIWESPTGQGLFIKR